MSILVASCCCLWTTKTCWEVNDRKTCFWHFRLFFGLHNIMGCSEVNVSEIFQIVKWLWEILQVWMYLFSKNALCKGQQQKAYVCVMNSNIEVLNNFRQSLYSVMVPVLTFTPTRGFYKMENPSVFVKLGLPHEGCDMDSNLLYDQQFCECGITLLWVREDGRGGGTEEELQGGRTLGETSQGPADHWTGCLFKKSCYKFLCASGRLAYWALWESPTNFYKGCHDPPLRGSSSGEAGHGQL